MTPKSAQSPLPGLVKSYSELFKIAKALHRDKWWDRPKEAHDNLCLVCPKLKEAEDLIRRCEGLS